MENFFTYENIKQILVYSGFGALIGIYIYWITYAVTAGIKWLVKKLKGHKKKEDTTNE